jgi:hypothetical protein
MGVTWFADSILIVGSTAPVQPGQRFGGKKIAGDTLVGIDEERRVNPLLNVQL